MEEIKILIKKLDNKFYTDEGFSVNGPRNHKDEPSHTHDFAEFVYIFQGSCVHCVDGIDYPARKGDLLFINYKSVHSVRTNGTVNYADVILKPEFIDESLRGSENAFSLLQLHAFEEFCGTIRPDNCFVHFSREEQKQIETLILLGENEVSSRSVGSHLIVDAFIKMFLTLVFRKMALPMHEELGVDETLLLYLKHNCTKSLPMVQIAKKCGYSEAYFSRLFRKLTNTTYTDYLADLRIKIACELLVETRDSVDNIIYKCGFADRTKFFRKFKGKTGTTPLKYRKMSKSNTISCQKK